MKYPSKILLLLIFGLLKNILLFGDLSCPYLKSSRDGRFLAGLSNSRKTIKTVGSLGKTRLDKSTMTIRHLSSISHFAITRDGKKIAYCFSYDNLIYIFDLLKQQTQIIESKQSDWITDLVFTEHYHECLLASCSSDGTVKLWEKQKKYDLDYKFAQEIKGSKEKKINTISFGIMPHYRLKKSAGGGNYPATTLACGFDDGSIAVWWVSFCCVTRKYQFIQIHEIPPYTEHELKSIKHIEFYPKQLGDFDDEINWDVILAAEADNSVRLFNTDDTNFITIREPSDDELLSVSFSSFGRYIVLQTKSSTQIWNYETKTIYKTYETPNIISVALVEDVIDGEPSLILVMKDGYNGNIERIFVR